MTIKALTNPVFISVKPNGNPNSLGTVGVYVAGTSFATPATIWDTQTKDSTLTNPVTLASDGTKEIWYDVIVDIQVKDSDGNVIDQVLNVDPNLAATATGNYNLIQNGSFEIDTDGDGAPDNWTLATDTGGTIAIDATSGGQTHGDNGLKFTGTGSGGGTATSVKFSVLAGKAVTTQFSYKTSAATTTNTVSINWYKFDDSASSTPSTTIHTLASGNPTSWTSYSYRNTIPSDAVKAEIVINGVASGGTDKTGPTWFDNISVIQELATENTLFDTNGNEVLKTATTASAVNEVTITNAATGNGPTIAPSGETNVDLNINSKGTGVLKFNGYQTGYFLLSEQTASASATIDFTTGIDSTFTSYMIEIINAIPATDAAVLNLRVGTGATPTWVTSANYDTNASSGQTSMIFSNATSNTATNGGICGKLDIYNPSSGSIATLIRGHTISVTNVPLSTTLDCYGRYDQVTAVTAIRLFMSSGNITSGTFRLYGIL